VRTWAYLSSLLSQEAQAPEILSVILLLYDMTSDECIADVLDQTYCIKEMRGNDVDSIDKMEEWRGILEMKVWTS
jgi:hypothetical protein